jgi:hypothetical protein
MRLLAGFLIAAPFLFGALRLATTDGVDGRYLLVALAALAGVSLAFPRAGTVSTVSSTRVGVATMIGALAAATVAVLLGGRSTIAVGMVAFAFAICIAGGFAVMWRARRVGLQ